MNILHFVTHNLPERNDGFYNREGEIEKLKSFLLNKKIKYISISGEAGVGKTSLALEFIYSSILDSKAFESVVWATPKKYELVSKEGFLNILNPKVTNEDVRNKRMEDGVWVNSIADLCFTILSVSGYRTAQNEVSISFDINDVIAWMRVRKILLVIDDLDSWDWGEILNFVDKVPPDSAVVITSRRVIESQYLPGIAQISLDSLLPSVAFEMINKKCQDNNQ
jgi:predicted ribonuclease YlaK